MEWWREGGRGIRTPTILNTMGDEGYTKKIVAFGNCCTFLESSRFCVFLSVSESRIVHVTLSLQVIHQLLMRQRTSGLGSPNYDLKAVPGLQWITFLIKYVFISVTSSIYIFYPILFPYLAFLVSLYVLCQGCDHFVRCHPCGSHNVTEPSMIVPLAHAASFFLQ